MNGRGEGPRARGEERRGEGRSVGAGGNGNVNVNGGVYVCMYSVRITRIGIDMRWIELYRIGSGNGYALGMGMDRIVPHCLRVVILLGCGKVG